MSLIFQQLFEAESSTYTYPITEGESREAALIDPMLETGPRDAVVLENGLEGLGDHWGRLPATQAGGASSLNEGKA